MRSISDLHARLQNFGPQKQATANPTSATDPTEAGTATSVGADTIREPDGQTTPPTSDVPVLADRTDGSGITAPATQDFVESGKLAADFQSGAAAIREKLASGAWLKAAAPAATAPVATTTQAKEACAPGSIHLKIAAHLLETEQGRVMVSGALEEVLGKEAASELVRTAVTEQNQFEKEYLQEKLAAAELAEKYANEYAAHVEREMAFEGMIKQATAGMSEADSRGYREKLATSTQIIQRAAAAFEDHPQALYHFAQGVLGADKYAAAVEAGADPAAAMGDPMAEAPPADPAAGGEAPPSPEEIQQALMELIQAGVITTEQAEQLLQAVMQGGGGDPAAGGDPMAGGDPAAAGAPPEEDPTKMAAIDDLLHKVAASVMP